MTSVGFIFNNVPKLRLCYNLPPRHSYLEWSAMCTDTETCCKRSWNHHRQLSTTWMKKQTENEPPVKWLWVLMLFCPWQEKSSSEGSGFCIERWNKTEGKEDQSTHTESLARFSFLPHVYWTHPDFLSAHQADSNSSRETQNQRDIGSSPPPPQVSACHCLLLSKLSEHDQRTLGCAFQYQGQGPSHPDIHASKLSLHYAAFHS